MIVIKLSSLTINGSDGSLNSIVNSFLLVCEIKSKIYLLLKESSNLPVLNAAMMGRILLVKVPLHYTHMVSKTRLDLAWGNEKTKSQAQDVPMGR